MTSPVKFVKPADLFKMRRAKKQEFKFDITSQSPLKCVVKEPSPIKNIPNILKNPFKNRSVRRPLSFDSSNSPKKRPRSNSSSPKKRTKLIIQVDDEDANLEAPHFNSNGLSNCDSDYDDDEDHEAEEDEENDEDASQFLESLGVTVSQQDFPSLEKFKSTPKVTHSHSNRLVNQTLGSQQSSKSQPPAL